MTINLKIRREEQAQSIAGFKGLISLYALMHEIDISQFVRILEALDSSGRSLSGRTTYVRKFELNTIQDHLMDLRTYQEVLNFDAGIRQQIAYLQDQIDYDMGDTKPDVIASLVDSLHEAIVDATRNRKFLYLPNAEFYQGDHLFPKNMVERFPDAMRDVLDAETAYAVRLYTACVFHSMRVAEHGLRYIADELKVDITDNGKPCPIAFATWEKVLQAVEIKRTELRREVKSDTFIERQRHLAESASHCAHLKDWFRNDAMHSRRSYIEPEAIAALKRVAEFIALLCK